MWTGRGSRRNTLLILLLASVTISSSGCRSFGWANPWSEPLLCHRPNADEKASWNYVQQDLWEHPRYGPGIQWVESEILEKDCFPVEAEEARDADTDD